MIKKIILSIVIFSMSMSSFGVMDSTQAKKKNPSFVMDKSQKYTYNYYSYSKGKKKKILSYTMSYTKKNKDNYTGWINKKEYSYFQDRETKKYYYLNTGRTAEFAIPRKAKLKQKVYVVDANYKMYIGKVTNTKATVKTKAKTFKNCIEITDGKGRTYFAPGNGKVKTSYNGKTTMEVSKIAKKK